VAIQTLLLVGRQCAVGVNSGSVLDGVLVVTDDDIVAVHGGALERHERLGGAEQAGLDRHPLRCAAGVVDVDLADATDLVTAVGGHFAVPGETLELVDADRHSCPSKM